MRKMREAVYTFFVRTGIARALSYFHRDKLIILCFHSMALKDEHQFWPGVFISKEKLHELLDYLERSHFNVISLDDAERHLNGEAHFKYPVVITVDDGWRSSITELLPTFQAYQFPSTVYVTTYYCDHQIPVVNVLIQYWLWQKPTEAFDVEFQGQRYGFTGSVSDIVKLVEAAMVSFDDDQKTAFLSATASALGVGDDAIQAKRFHNANYHELNTAMASPLTNIQLHTHTHKLPTDSDAIHHEIETNREVLTAQIASPKALTHFCYPSGIWSPEHLPELNALGIRTATTLDEGLNARTEHPLKLKRNLVMDSRSLNQFIVTLSGVVDTLRWAMGKTRS
ncbi:polysaccharide deacetylase family protein [Enterovibrio sp. ZSDZ42]|uniref:Polysaccharide deacetylase family protein n=1 Tax=Enterovibrio gelatinilyticus TaxID=2899819 RepID=A0ABT5R530_9GAMM|nr:polysaccharide deacetylase family protein [Enterovibrio sp. ZSDZ42]MDD1795377.1 polysaccharide deacetylase family protein [Enterovibrio sp. ZSDZ42]